MKDLEVERILRQYAEDLVSRYTWLTIRFEYSEKRSVYLVSYSPKCLISGNDTLINEIEKDPTSFLTVQSAANYLVLSESHFARQFKQHTGHSFNSYVSAKRLDRAKLLLAHTTKPVLRIATELDFQPVNYFSRCFKKHFGITPSQYRNQFSGGTA